MIEDFLIIGAFRYALGRQTYVVQETADWLVSNWSRVSVNAQVVIIRDLHEAILKDAVSKANGLQYRPLGSDIDRAEWMKLWEKVMDLKPYC